MNNSNRSKKKRRRKKKKKKKKKKHSGFDYGLSWSWSSSFVAWKTNSNSFDVYLIGCGGEMWMGHFARSERNGTGPSELRVPFAVVAVAVSCENSHQVLNRNAKWFVRRTDRPGSTRFDSSWISSPQALPPPKPTPSDKWARLSQSLERTQSGLEMS